MQETEEYDELPARQKQIMHARYSTDPIALYDSEFFQSDKFYDMILVWCSYVGIRKDLPDELSMAFISDFLLNDAGGLTFDEIFIALKMNTLGELTRDKDGEPEIINHFQQFNVHFLGRVIKAYQKARKKADDEFNKIRFKIEKPPVHVPDKVELCWISAQTIYDDFYRVIMGEKIYMTGSKYDFLVKVGLIVVSEEEFNARISEGEKMLQDRFLNTKEREKVRYLGDILNTPFRFVYHAKECVKDMILHEHLRSHMNPFPQNEVQARHLGNLYCDLLESKIRDYIALHLTISPMGDEVEKGNGEK